MKSTIKFRPLILLIGIGTFLTVLSTSCKKDDPTPTPPAVTPTVVGVAQSDTSFSILVAAVVKANLATTLSDVTKSYTVFAPTNNAFRAAGISDVATINSLTADQVTSYLTPLLLYHVIGAKVVAANVPVSDTVKTLNTKNIFASKNANGVFVNGIKVTTADINASNGVVHVIGSVLVPPTKTITQIVVDNPDFSTLKAVVVLAGLDGVLAGPGKFTVFAPNNAAFVTSGVTDLSGFSSTQAADIIKQHAFGSNIFASDLVTGTTGVTLNPTKTLDVTTSPVTVKITGSPNPASAVTSANIVATNGVIHVINRVLLP